MPARTQIKFQKTGESRFGGSEKDRIVIFWRFENSCSGIETRKVSFLFSK